MLKKNISALSCLLVLTGCASVQDYVPPQNTDTANVVVTRNITAPLLGYTSTLFKLETFKTCHEEIGKNKATRFMVLDKGNPLIAEVNAEGVDVAVNEPVNLFMVTVAGPFNGSCSSIVKFTPESGKDYEIRLLGDITQSPGRCTAELWSTQAGSNIAQQDSFEEYDDCNPQ
ncbi:hypothetical protein [Amphritea sp.]|uniref:hypothetical protein n=1 Tax=Amphritea sp. TaxID=1872502 RepID=UPI003D0A5612